MEIAIAQSRHVGSCNGCPKHITSFGAVPHQVWVIDLRGCSVRLCADCAKELVYLLGHSLDSPGGGNN